MGPEVSYHGFKLQRHISDEATVITYKAADGSLKRMAVKDAKFRSVQKFGTYSLDVPELANFEDAPGNFYVIGDASIPAKGLMPESVNNEAIFSYWADSLKADNTAKANCDIWMTYNDKTDTQKITGVPAVAWCRAQVLFGKPCDLPNEYELICLWACGNKLDEMDKTAPTYSNMLLGDTATNKQDGNVYIRSQKYNGYVSVNLFSSTVNVGNSMRGVTYQGYCRNIAKNALGTAIPILELD